MELHHKFDGVDITKNVIYKFTCVMSNSALMILCVISPRSDCDITPHSSMYYLLHNFSYMYV